MKIHLLAHSQINGQDPVLAEFLNEDFKEKYDATDGQIISLAAIRQCYSYKKAIEVLETESEKYFGEKAKEGKRLFNTIITSGHTSTMEHIHFTFAVEGVSRALLAQLTRHRHLSFSVQSQRYNKFSSDSRSGGFEYVVPEKVKDEMKKTQSHNLSENAPTFTALKYFEDCMDELQHCYNKLIECGIPQEDARAVLPNAATCNLVISGNLRSFLEFYKKRKAGNGAQHEIAMLAEEVRRLITSVEGWTDGYFD